LLVNKDSVKVIKEEGAQKPLTRDNKAGTEHVARPWTSLKLISQFLSAILCRIWLHTLMYTRQGASRKCKGVRSAFNIGVNLQRCTVWEQCIVIYTQYWNESFSDSGFYWFEGEAQTLHSE
jgi:hypothetical protein